QRFGEARQAPDAQHRELQQNGGPEQQINRLDEARERRGESRPEDAAEGRARRDKAEQPLRLLRVEDIDHERPENRDHEKIEDRSPDEKYAADPDRLLRARAAEQQEEQQ